MLLCGCPQRRGRERHAVPGFTGDEKPGEARECRGHQNSETSKPSHCHDHRYASELLASKGTHSSPVDMSGYLSVVKRSKSSFRSAALVAAGDNILTAVNVAGSCEMVGSDERVIFVHATPHTAESRPTLRFHLGEGGATSSQNSAEVLSQVCHHGLSD